MMFSVYVRIMLEASNKAAENKEVRAHSPTSCHGKSHIYRALNLIFGKMEANRFPQDTENFFVLMLYVGCKP